MTILRLLILSVSLQFFSLVDLLASDTYFIRDIWTDQPISGAEISTLKYCVFSDEVGAFKINFSASDSIRISIVKEGYFTLTLRQYDLKNPIIYLTPIENTGYILSIKPRITNTSLRLPSHISRIYIDQSRIISTENIADILSEQGGVFMKSYGPAGQIQSISIRGMSPEQTQILFDGIPMNNLQLGSVDLSYYPLPSIGSLEIYRGGNTLFGGSGSIGGSVDLHPKKLLYETGYDISSSYNSLDAFTFSGFVDFPVKSYRQRIFLNHAKAINNFKTDYEDRRISLENRDYQQILYGYQNAINISKNILLNGFFSGYQRESGSPEAFINPEKEQENLARSRIENYLAKIRLNYNTAGFGLNVQGYQRDEQMAYSDTSLVINFQSLRSIHKNKETGFQFRTHYLLLNKAIINSGIESAWQQINSTDAGEHRRQRLAFYLLGDYEIFSNYMFFIQSLNLNGALRYERFSNYDPIVLPGLGINIQGSFWQIYLTGSRNYRIPTFNELYWQPGGNSNLNPEESINLESGLELNKNFGRIITFELQAAFYQNEVENQIKWLPDGIIWMPKNISQVLSRGLEMETSVSDIKKLHRMSFKYHYGISEKQKAEFDGDETIGNQLPYLPREQWHLNAQSGWRSVRFGFNYSGISFRYKTIQNISNQILPAHSISDVYFGYEFNLNNNNINLSLVVKNLFNKNYQIMDGYPMPGRNYTFTIRSQY